MNAKALAGSGPSEIWSWYVAEVDASAVAEYFCTGVASNFTDRILEFSIRVASNFADRFSQIKLDSLGLNLSTAAYFLPLEHLEGGLDIITTAIRIALRRVSADETGCSPAGDRQRSSTRTRRRKRLGTCERALATARRLGFTDGGNVSRTLTSPPS